MHSVPNCVQICVFSFSLERKLVTNCTNALVVPRKMSQILMCEQNHPRNRKKHGRTERCAWLIHIKAHFFLPLRTKTGACLTVTDHILPRILHVRMDINASTRGSWSPMILHFSFAAVQLTSTSCPNCSPVLFRPCLLLQVCNWSTTGTTFPLNVTPILLLYFFVVWLGLWGTSVNTGPRGFLWLWSVSEAIQIQVLLALISLLKRHCSHFSWIITAGSAVMQSIDQIVFMASVTFNLL